MSIVENKENWMALLIAILGKNYDADSAIRFMRL